MKRFFILVLSVHDEKVFFFFQKRVFELNLIYMFILGTLMDIHDMDVNEHEILSNFTLSLTQIKMK